MATIKFIQAQKFSLAGSGTSIGDTTIILQSMVGIDGSNIVTADLGVLAFGTLEPGNGSQEEAISFTGVTQNANGTATLTGVKTVLFKSPYTGTSGLAKTHAGASTFILSNDAGFYGQILDYIDTAIVSGGVPSTTTVLGLVKMSTTPASANSPIAVGDNDVRVPTANPTSLFLSLNASAAPITNVYSTGTTWVKPNRLNYIIVEVQGGGGGGGASSGNGTGAGGGGGGGYGKKLIPASSLATGIGVIVGGGVAGSTSGSNASFGTFVSASGGALGTDVSGPSAGGAGGNGGSASGGDVTIAGGVGGWGIGSTVAGVYSLGGPGGGSQLGRGGQMVAIPDGGTGITGNPGANYGGGGAGGARDATSGGTGGTGAQGLVIVTEYYT